jgi:hypothetical protein
LTAGRLRVKAILAFLAGPLYFPPMRRLFRQLLVVVTSLAFVAGISGKDSFCSIIPCLPPSGVP